MAHVGLQLEEYIGDLKVQNKKLHRRYDNLLFLVTAPVKDELEVPDDLNFLGNTVDVVTELPNQNNRLLSVSSTNLHIPALHYLFSI